MPAISVLLTTYERPRALACTLEGYARQTFTDFEIVLGDDGSGPETKEVVEAYQKKLSVPIIHAWGEHHDHGRTRVINRTFREANSDYFVLSDADCIPAANFLQRHWEERRPGHFCCGRRLMLGKEFTEITPEDVVAGRHLEADVTSSWDDIFKRERKGRFYKLCRPLYWSRLRLLGANFAMWRTDAEAINGFDEGYVGWGAADEDFRRRLRRAGIRWRSVMPKALVYHIPHPPVKSKPAKVKEGNNAGRYDEWLYLTQPLKGLDKREATELFNIIGTKQPKIGEERVITTSGKDQVLKPEVRLLKSPRGLADALGPDAIDGPGDSKLRVRGGQRSDFAEIVVEIALSLTKDESFDEWVEQNWDWIAEQVENALT